MADTKCEFTNMSESSSSTPSLRETQMHGRSADADADIPEVDALHTPIHQPLPSSLKSKQGNSALAYAAAADTPAELEEAASDAFVHAACRVHEAAMLAKAACNELVFWSSGTGMQPHEAAQAAKDLIDTEKRKIRQLKGVEDKHGNRSDRSDRKDDDSVLVVQAGLMATLSAAAAAGAMAGMAVEARRNAGSLLRPLPALSSSPTTASIFASTRATTLTGNDLAALAQHLDEMWALTLRLSFIGRSNLTTLLGAISDAVSRIKDFVRGQQPLQLTTTIRLASSEAAADVAEQRVAKSVVDMLQAFVATLHSAATSIDVLVLVATALAAQTRKKESRARARARAMPGRIAARVLGWLRGTTSASALSAQPCPDGPPMRDTVQDLLLQAQQACEQSVSAVQEAEAYIDRAVVKTTSGIMRTVWEASMQ